LNSSHRFWLIQVAAFQIPVGYIWTAFCSLSKHNNKTFQIPVGYIWTPLNFTLAGYILRFKSLWDIFEHIYLSLFCLFIICFKSLWDIFERWYKRT